MVIRKLRQRRQTTPKPAVQKLLGTAGIARKERPRCRRIVEKLLTDEASWPKQWGPQPKTLAELVEGIHAHRYFVSDSIRVQANKMLLETMPHSLFKDQL